ncbi:hypothetical protein GLUCOINTEAF2_0203362 [Komagataeibacter intermedius AF2]|uniref:Uncharacterized protein n=1 Tax=Komagataeibacter intermedius AF2 TaxID=1458464 RepID=A0A0N1FIT1_9PROT|nr:hypothetical protein GLUCOINTEAF2_0203362 [Komagataeibacter intermedius AF2]
MSVSALHEASYGDVDHGLCDVDTLLVILHRLAQVDYPGQCPFDDPSMQQNFKPFCRIGLPDDRDREVEKGDIDHITSIPVHMGCQNTLCKDRAVWLISGKP